MAGNRSARGGGRRSSADARLALAAPQFDLVCEDSWRVDLLQSCMNIGFFISFLGTGYIADRYVQARATPRGRCPGVGGTHADRTVRVAAEGKRGRGRGPGREQAGSGVGTSFELGQNGLGTELAAALSHREFCLRSLKVADVFRVACGT